MKKILVVDDSKIQRKMIIMFMQKAGCKNPILEAENGDKAIEVLAANFRDIGLVLCDWQMPKMTGLEFILAVRKVSEKIKGLAAIPIVIVTAEGSDVKKAKAKQEAPDLAGFINKPFTLVKFNDVIAPILSKYQEDQAQDKLTTADHIVEEFSLKGMRVLLVEDVLINQKVIKVFLDKFGCVSDFANNGQEAIEKIKSNLYDVCLMDLQMPVMDGIEAAEIIRRDINKEIPIIALTAAEMEDGRRVKAFASGMNDFLIKPINKNKLREALSKWKEGLEGKDKIIVESDESQFLDEFKAEVRDRLQQISTDLWKLEKNPQDKELLKFLMREAHTIKGAARMMGYTSISEISHKIEEVLEKVKNGTIQLEKDSFDVLLKCVDEIELLLSDLE